MKTKQRKHDLREAYKYKVSTIRYDYYLIRKADYCKLVLSRNAMCKRLVIEVMEEISKITLAYNKQSERLGLDDRKNFDLLCNQVVMLCHSTREPKDYERRVYNIYCAALSLLSSLKNCKKIYRRLSALYDIAFSEPAKFYHLSDYLVIPKK